MKPIVVIVLSLVCTLSVSSPARCDNVGRDAGKHFARGVDLYNEGDFRGALVEFRRAYTMLPRANVLYDIGETELQLQEYAGALNTMRRYLSETGPGALHRTEVEATVEMLRGRVGKVAVTTDLARCDVSVDEQSVGTTPLAEPLTVSVGQRRVTVACPARPNLTRRVEVAAGELVRVDVHVEPALTTMPEQVAPRPSPEAVQRRRHSMLALAWTSTAILAAATISVGAASLVESSQLGALRETYPVLPGALDSKASLTRGLSIAADALGVAALAAIGVSTYVTVKQHRERKLALGFGIGPSGVSVRGAF